MCLSGATENDVSRCLKYEVCSLVIATASRAAPLLLYIAKEQWYDVFTADI